MDDTQQNEGHKSGFVAVMGKPNVGKSTLINALLGQKIAAVSPRPQTTRKRQLGILTLDSAQIIFIDTPGVHKPHHKLGENMNTHALETLQECDLVLFIVDSSAPPDDEDQLLATALQSLEGTRPVILALNKIDRLEAEQITDRQAEFMQLAPEATPVLISATRGDQLDLLLQEIVLHLPQGPIYYPPDQVTDLYEREIAADLIREAALNLLRDEVPHGIAIRIDQFTERDTQGAYIEATIFVERESHKGIVIGQGGSMLKQIGTTARREIEAMSGRKVFLRLRVKVRKNWRNNEKVLRLFGF
ncbi:MAG: GTPase Era [Anaerolineales bacterium]